MRPLPSLLSVPLLLLVACGGPDPAQDHGHGHGHGHDATEASESPTIAGTRWNETHELFIELDAPVAGSTFAYHAHVTRLADNAPATEGTLTLRFEQDGFPSESHRDDAVARPGIFAGEAAAPADPGTYELLVSFAADDARMTWPLGTVTVGADEPVPHPSGPEGDIAFSKEAQWQIPFRVATARMGELAPVLSASGVARPAPDATAVVAAPTDGLVIWADDPPTPGMSVRKGDRLGRMLPAGVSAHWARLQAELRTAKADLDLAEANLARIESLSEGDLVSTRRLEEARAARTRAASEVNAAARRLDSLSSQDDGAVSILAPASGVVTHVGPAHGTRITAGAPLVTVASTDALLVDARVYDHDADRLSPLHSLVATTAHLPYPVDLLAMGATLGAERLVFDPDVLSAPLAVRVPPGSGLRQGDLVELELGAGPLTSAVVVPRDAVVELNGQDVLFVQIGGESFARRRVVLGDRNATHVAVLSGIEVGVHVVVEGGFDVHVASLTGALESHRR